MRVNWHGVFPAITTQLRHDQSLDLAPTLVIERMKEAAASGDPQQFFQHDLTIHQTLSNLSHNSLLPWLLEQALDSLLVFLFIRNIRRKPGIDMRESTQAILIGHKSAARRLTLERLTMFADQHLALYE